MIQAIRQTVTVKTKGRIEIAASELREGMAAEVIVLGEAAQPRDASPNDLQAAIATAQGIVRQHVPQGQLLSEALIQERRAESARE